MKFIKIVTYCTDSSIGSILQSFGLKSALSHIGVESKILLEKTADKKEDYHLFNIKSAIRQGFKLMIKRKLTVAKKKRNNFIATNIDIEYYGNSWNVNCAEDSLCYLAGSDQIWNPNKCYPPFFLDFAENKKRISYAASMGSTVIPDEKKEEFIRLLNNFETISVRERECAEVIRDLTGKEASVHIDPTFLISFDEWRTYEKKYDIKEPYILLYMIYWDESLKEKVKALSQRTGLKVYTIKNGLSRAYGDKILYDVGIDEFLWLVDHAEYVVTSSFHGVAMATIFNKKFSAVVNPASPSRIENLLRVLSIPHVDIDDLDSADNFDYTVINQKILEERERGIEYLREALK